MDKIIKKIVEIDEKALKIRQQTENILKNNNRDLEEKLQKIEKDGIQEAEEKADRQYNRIIKEGQKEVETITQTGEDKINRLEEVFSKKMPKIQSEIFEEIFINRIKKGNI